MSDVNAMLIEPLQRFVKDSIYLEHDQKGELELR
jgi:hypothetical protein